MSSLTTTTTTATTSASVHATLMQRVCRYGVLLMALSALASTTSGCMADGDDYGEFDETGDAEAGAAENVGQTQQAFSNPGQGTYTVAFYKDRWGKDELNHCNDLPVTTYCGSDDYSPNNKLTSFRICNNLSSDHSFRVRLWDHDDYVELIYDESFLVASDGCIAHNVPANDNNRTSSLKVQP